jgi:deoxyribodipyrimidine photo-lyase
MQTTGDAGTGRKGGNRAIIWFRGTDLRVHDNVIVHDAVTRVQRQQVAEVLPVFCFDPHFFSATAWGSAKTGPHRAQFLLDSVADLKQQLRAIGSDLMICMGRPEEVSRHRCAVLCFSSTYLHYVPSCSCCSSGN